MSTSLYGELRQFPASLYGAAADPADTVLLRDAVANNLLHAADSMGQVRVNYVGIKSGSIDVFETFDTVLANAPSQTFCALGGQPFGPWPLTLHADMTPYILRIRVGVASSNTTASTLQLRVVIAPIGAEVLSEVDRAQDNVFHVEWVSSGAGSIGTTPTWIDDNGTTRFARTQDNDFTSYMVVSAAQAEEWTQRYPIADAVSGGTPRAVDQCLVAAHVFGSTTHNVAESRCVPRLYGLHIQEYVGT